MNRITYLLSAACALFFLPQYAPASGARIVIDRGGSYVNQTYEGTVEVNTSELVIFDDCSFLSSGNGIEVFHPDGGNVEIRNCTFTGLHPGQYGKTQGRSVHINGRGKSTTFVFENNAGTGFRGIWVQKMAYGATVRIKCNQWRNIEGRMSDGKGGYLAEPDPNPENSQFLLFTETTGAAVDIAWNFIQNEPGQSKVEDVINVGGCKGGSARPIRIAHNLIYGAYSYAPRSDKQYSGSGIQIETNSAYVEIAGNVIVNAANTGLALSWARRCTVRDNLILSTGLLPGTDDPICQSWRGLLIGNPYWHPEDSRNNKAFGNRVWYVENLDPAGGCNISGKALAPIECLPGNTCTDNEIPEGLPGPADEAAAIEAWHVAAAKEGRSVGVQE